MAKKAHKKKIGNTTNNIIPSKGFKMKNMMLRYGLAVLALGVLAQGCSSTGLMPMMKMRGAEELVETSGKKPSMVSDSQWAEEKGDKKLFGGFSDQVHDLDVALRSAEMEARKHLIENISQEIRAEGVRGQSGSDKEAVGRFFEDSQAWLTKNIRVSGAQLLNTYWEKWSRLGDGEVAYFYRGYAVVQISKADYARAVESAVEKLIDKAAVERNREAENAAREVKERLLEGKEREE